MSQPLPSQIHLAAWEANLDVGFGRQDFIADLVFPVLTVKKQTNRFPVLRKGAFFRLDAKKRAPGTPYYKSGYNWTYSTYFCDDIGLGHEIPIEDIQNADDPFSPIEDGYGFCENAVLLAREKAVSDLLTTAGNWTTSEDVEGGWAATDSTNTFYNDIIAAKRTVRELTGFEPNFLEISANTFDYLKQSSVLLDRIKYGGTQGKPADITPSMIASLFELDKCVIGKAIYSSAEEVQAGTDFTAVRLFETNATKGGAFLGYIPRVPAARTPSAGYTLMWPNAVPEVGWEVELRGNTTVRRKYDGDSKVWKVDASQRFDCLVAAADAGYCFYDTITT